MRGSYIALHVLEISWVEYIVLPLFRSELVIIYLMQLHVRAGPPLSIDPLYIRTNYNPIFNFKSFFIFLSRHVCHSTPITFRRLILVLFYFFFYLFIENAYCKVGQLNLPIMVIYG